MAPEDPLSSQDQDAYQFCKELLQKDRSSSYKEARREARLAKGLSVRRQVWSRVRRDLGIVAQEEVVGESLPNRDGGGGEGAPVGPDANQGNPNPQPGRNRDDNEGGYRERARGQESDERYRGGYGDRDRGDRRPGPPRDRGPGGQQRGGYGDRDRGGRGDRRPPPYRGGEDRPQRSDQRTPPWRQDRNGPPGGRDDEQGNDRGSWRQNDGPDRRGRPDPSDRRPAWRGNDRPNERRQEPDRHDAEWAKDRPRPTWARPADDPQLRGRGPSPTPQTPAPADGPPLTPEDLFKTVPQTPIEFMVEYLKTKNAEASFDELRIAAEAKGHTIYPATFGRAQSIAGILDDFEPESKPVRRRAPAAPAPAASAIAPASGAPANTDPSAIDPVAGFQSFFAAFSNSATQTADIRNAMETMLHVVKHALEFESDANPDSKSKPSAS